MRQPIHTVYGGAHLFTRDTCAKMGRLALALLDDFGAALPHEALIRAKLEREPLEDYRIDFEDGYGLRSSEEEDEDARRAATELAELAAPPPFIGFRIRAFEEGTRDRALRTLQIFLRNLEGKIPTGFRITLPKARGSRDAADFVRALGRAEQEFGIGQPIACEFLIETPGAVRSVREILSAAEGRCVALHFGAYDFLTRCGVSAVAQTLHHPLCDHARAMMQIAVAELQSPVALVDGATNAIPARAAGAEAVRAAWEIHQRDIRRSLDNGFYQSWDLHPGQIVSRYAAVYSFFRNAAPQLAAQLKHFREQGQRASVLGTDFADSANARGLELHFERALHCGAITAGELP